MIQIPEHIAELIEKQLKSQLTPQDAHTLQAWRSASTSHEQVFRQIKSIWRETGTILQERTYDSSKAWEKVDGRLDGGRDKSVVRMLTRVATAACIAGLLIFGGWWFFNEKTAPLQMASAEEANKTLILPDGSQVTLRKGATLTYPEKFTGDKREVTLTGEAYFDVQHDASHPFRIQTQRAQLEVLGTTFTVITNQQQDELTVTTGKVRFTNKATGGGEQLILPDQHSVLTEKGFETTTTKDANFLSWKTGVLTFDNTPVNQVANALSRYYNQPIVLDKQLLQLPTLPTITSTYTKQPIDSVLEEMKVITLLRYRKQNDTIILYKP